MYNYTLEKDLLKINFSGNFTSFKESKTEMFNDLIRVKKVEITTNNLNNWDSSLVIIIYKIIKISKTNNIEVDYNNIQDNLKQLINLAFSVDRKPEHKDKIEKDFFIRLADKYLFYKDSFLNGFDFIKESLKSIKRFFIGKAVVREVDIYFAFEDCSFKSLPIVSLINFMVGVILAFVGAMELEMFGAQIYVASLVSISMVRIMSAIMVGIIMSGRTGASYAATIGTMQVNEEIDALKTMGISPIDFLVLPRLLSLIVVMPILTIFASILGILGGAFVGILALDLSYSEYFRMSLEVLNTTHFLIGLLHSFVFGIIISLCGCYYGINCGKDADSVGKSTTKAVVASIVWIIVATGIITFFCEVL